MVVASWVRDKCNFGFAKAQRLWSSLCPILRRICQESKALWLPVAERQGGGENAVSAFAEDMGARLGRWHAWEPASLGQRPHPFFIPAPPVTPSFPVNKDVSLAPPEGKEAMALSRGRQRQPEKHSGDALWISETCQHSQRAGRRGERESRERACRRMWRQGWGGLMWNSRWKHLAQYLTRSRLGTPWCLLTTGSVDPVPNTPFLSQGVYNFVQCEFWNSLCATSTLVCVSDLK